MFEHILFVERMLQFSKDRDFKPPSQDAKDWVTLFIRYPPAPTQNCPAGWSILNLAKQIQLKMLSHKGITNYLICHENGDHFHILMECTNETYENYITSLKKCLPFPLGGKNSGHAGHYGKVKVIKNIDNLLSYLTKDGDFVSTFSHTTWLQEQQTKSYKKPKLNKSNFREKLFSYLSDRTYHDLQTCMIRIIDFYRSQGDKCPAITKSALRNHALNYFLQISATAEEGTATHFKYTSEEIYNLIID